MGSSMIYIGIGGNVVALDRSTGEEVWRSALKGSAVVNVALLDGDLYATARGELFCLDPATGMFVGRIRSRGSGAGSLPSRPPASRRS